MLSFAVLARRARPALRKSIRRAMTSTRGIPQIGGNPKLVEFELLTASDQQDGPRLGRFTFKGRPSFDTPHFVASSSRGTVSHMTQDMMRDQTAIKSMYAAVEDFIEKAPHGQSPPVYNVPVGRQESALREFTALPKDVLLLLGPRRIPPLRCPTSSTSTSISIVTSTGFSMLSSEDYVTAVQNLRPDIVIGMGDVLFGHKPGVKRLERMGDRTLAWIGDLLEGMVDEEEGTPSSALFAPILPIEPDIQRWYLESLCDTLVDKISGLAVYGLVSAASVPASLGHLPRFYAEPLGTPHDVLDTIAAGLDLVTVSFVNEVSDAGTALNFLFPQASSPEEGKKKVPLGLDLWQAMFATDVSSLSADCKCYTCRNHHRAYIHHLFNAREMLGWVLLQVHNYHVLSEFFTAIREALLEGRFQECKEEFHQEYKEDFPASTGEGPRLRGYQVKSKGGGEPRMNHPAWNNSMNDKEEKLAEGGPMDHDVDAAELTEIGFAEKVEES